MKHDHHRAATVAIAATATSAGQPSGYVPGRPYQTTSLVGRSLVIRKITPYYDCGGRVRGAGVGLYDSTGRGAVSWDVRYSEPVRVVSLAPPASSGGGRGGENGGGWQDHDHDG